MQAKEIIEYLQGYRPETKVVWIAVNPTARKKYDGSVMVITGEDVPVFAYEITAENDLEEEEVQEAEQDEKEAGKRKIKHTAMEEASVMHWDLVRSLCISKRLYTRGTVQQYRELELLIDGWEETQHNVTTEMLQVVAEDILEHSETEYGLESLMFEISRTCVHRFYAAALH